MSVLADCRSVFICIYINNSCWLLLMLRAGVRCENCYDRVCKNGGVCTLDGWHRYCLCASGYDPESNCAETCVDTCTHRLDLQRQFGKFSDGAVDNFHFCCQAVNCSSTRFTIVSVSFTISLSGRTSLCV